MKYASPNQFSDLDETSEHYGQGLSEHVIHNVTVNTVLLFDSYRFGTVS